jgi:hypothetical protein
MTSYLSIIHATIAERSTSEAEAKILRFAASATGSVLLAGLVDAYESGGFEALVAQLEADIQATEAGLAELGKAVDLPPFGPQMRKTS